MKFFYEVERKSVRIDAKDGEELTELQAYTVTLASVVAALDDISNRLIDISQDIAATA